jgi:ketosteroid isomerase-like protein
MAVLARIDKLRNVPVGEYKPVKEAFYRSVQTVAKGCEALMEKMSDDVVYVNPMGAVVFGKGW